MLMSRFPRLLLLGSLLLGAALAAESTQGIAPYTEGRLFRVTAPDGEKSHVFGTMHSNDPRVLNLPGSVVSSFEASRTFLPEIALPATDIRGRMESLLQRGRYPSLEAVLGQDELLYRALKALSKRGIPEYQARQFPAWTALFYLAQSRPGGSSIRRGDVLDSVLVQRARSRGMVVVGLETPEQQFDVFGGLSIPEQAELIRLTLDGEVWFFDDDGRSEHDAVSDYISGRTGHMYAEVLAGESTELIRKVNRRLLYDRNRNMVEKMLPFIDAGGAFVAVGALHLPGEEGVLRLLESRGYLIERLQ